MAKFGGLWRTWTAMAKFSYLFLELDAAFSQATEDSSYTDVKTE